MWIFLLSNLAMGATVKAVPLFLPYEFTAELLPTALDSGSDPFGIDPEQTSLITTGLDTGP